MGAKTKDYVIQTMGPAFVHQVFTARNAVYPAHTVSTAGSADGGVNAYMERLVTEPPVRVIVQPDIEACIVKKPAHEAPTDPSAA